MHEFNVINNGKNALYICRRAVPIDLFPYKDMFEVDAGLINDLGIHEIDLTTGEILFEWWSTDHIPLSDSSAVIEDITGPWPGGWNWM